MNRIALFASSFTLALVFAPVACTTSEPATAPSSEATGKDGDPRPEMGPGERAPVSSTSTGNVGCTGADRTTTVVGSGTKTRSTRDVKSFHGVAIHGVATMVVTDGAAFGVEVETDDNLQAIVSTTVSADGNLVVEGSRSYCTEVGVRVLVTMPTIDEAVVEGSGAIEATKTTTASDLRLTVRGSGNLLFHGAAASLAVTIDGSGTVVLDRGSATKTNVVILGSGVIRATSFTPGAVTKRVDGSGVVDL